ncbi:MAG: hypothetical protein ACLQFR_10805 [Streptosporangiaceae bacterium]
MSTEIIGAEAEARRSIADVFAVPLGRNLANFSETSANFSESGHTLSRAGFLRTLIVAT